jgi:hypothetical protein
MIDKLYLQNLIEKIEHEMNIHDQKFAGNPAHKDCLPRFKATLEKLRAEIMKEDIAKSS